MTTRPTSPLISVIVPAHNCEKYIRECVASIMQQTYENWELILVDDSSTDTTGSICDKFASDDTRIHTEHISVRDVSSARNHGIRISKGDLICFLDADDAYLPAALEIMEKGLRENQCDIVVSQFVFSRNNRLRTPKKISWYVCNGKDATANVLFQKRLWHCSPWGKLFRRKTIESTQLFKQGIRFEDLEISPRHFLASEYVAVTDAKLYFYRDHSISFMNTWSPKRLDVLKVTDRIEEYMRQNIPELLPAAKDRKFSANFNMFINAIQNRQYDLARNCWAVIREYRLDSLLGSQVRIKNKVGALFSYTGYKFCKTIIQWLGQ